MKAVTKRKRVVRTTTVVLVLLAPLLVLLPQVFTIRPASPPPPRIVTASAQHQFDTYEIALRYVSDPPAQPIRGLTVVIEPHAWVIVNQALEDL